MFLSHYYVYLLIEKKKSIMKSILVLSFSSCCCFITPSTCHLLDIVPHLIRSLIIGLKEKKKKKKKSKCLLSELNWNDKKDIGID